MASVIKKTTASGQHRSAINPKSKESVKAGSSVGKSTYIRKRGNSAGINLSAQALAVSGLTIDSAVSIEAREGEIIIKAAKPQITLDDLLANSPEAKLKQSNKDSGWFDDDQRGMELI